MEGTTQLVQDSMVEVMYSYVADGILNPVTFQVVPKFKIVAEQFGFPVTLEQSKYNERGDRRIPVKFTMVCQERWIHTCNFRLLLGGKTNHAFVPDSIHSPTSAVTVNNIRADLCENRQLNTIGVKGERIICTGTVHIVGEFHNHFSLTTELRRELEVDMLNLGRALRQDGDPPYNLIFHYIERGMDDTLCRECMRRGLRCHVQQTCLVHQKLPGYCKT